MRWLWILLGRSAAWLDGDQAYYDGCRPDSNPYTPNTEQYAEWINGYYRRT